MTNRDPSSWLDRLVWSAFAILLAAIALYAAVRIIQAVWVWLCIGLLVAAVATAGGFILRRRYGRW